MNTIPSTWSVTGFLIRQGACYRRASNQEFRRVKARKRAWLRLKWAAAQAIMPTLVCSMMGVGGLLSYLQTYAVGGM